MLRLFSYSSVVMGIFMHFPFYFKEYIFKFTQDLIQIEMPWGSSVLTWLFNVAKSSYSSMACSIKLSLGTDHLFVTNDQVLTANSN